MGAVKSARKRIRQDWLSYDGEVCFRSFVEYEQFEKEYKRMQHRYWDYPYSRYIYHPWTLEE